MRRKKKTTIVTFESHERMSIRKSSPSLVSWCDRCGTEVLMIVPNEAAAITGSDARAIFRDVEAGKIHFIEREGGSLLVCANSLRERR